MNLNPNSNFPRGMRTLKKSITTVDPPIQRELLGGKRFVERLTQSTAREYAGRRTFTPGVIPAFDISPCGRSPEVAYEAHDSRRFVFSAFYRPQIRLQKEGKTATPARVAQERRLRKPPCTQSRAQWCSLKASILSFSAEVPHVIKHYSYSLKKLSGVEVPRRARKSHPEVTAKMRRGNNIGELLRSQWPVESIDLSARSTACSSRL
jgi:hypothetical protein